MENRNWINNLGSLLLVFVGFAAFLLPSLLGQNAKKEKVDLHVADGIVVTMNPEGRIFASGAVAVKGDLLVAVGSRESVEGKYSAAQTISASGKLILPGFINGHTHVPMTLLRGLKDDVTLEEWLTKFIFPAEAKNVNEEFVRWGTRLAAAEQIRGGVP